MLLRDRTGPRPRRSAWPAARLLSLFALTACPAAAASEDPIRLLSADRSGVSFEVVTAEPAIEPLEGVSFHRVSLAGFAEGGALGEPALPERIVWIGLPEGVEAAVTAVSLESRLYDGVLPLPRLSREELEDGREEEIPRLARVLARAGTDAPAYRSGPPDGPPAEHAGYTALRAQRLVAVRLRPVFYEAAGRRLRVHTRFQVRVDFSGLAADAARPGRDEAFEPIYRDLVLNHESAKEFRRAVGGTRRPGYGALAVAQSGPDFTAATRWVRVRVRSKGIQRLSGQDLQGAGVPTGAVAASSLRLFTRRGLPILPEDTFCDTCGIAEVAIRVDDGGDGRFDANDQVLFFGLPASGWSDDYTGPDTASGWWIDHLYANENSYWLTWDAAVATPARRWVGRSVAPVEPGAVPALHFPARAHFEENRVYLPNLYEPRFYWDQWIWQTVTQNLGAVVFRADAPGAVPTEPARLFARFWGVSLDATGFPDHFLRVRINSLDLEQRSWNGRARRDVDTTGVFVQETGNLLRVEVPVMVDPVNPSRDDQQAFLFWELHYRRKFQPAGDLLEFESPEGAGPATPMEIALSPVTASALPTFTVLDVTDPLAPLELQGFSLRDTTGGKAFYWHEALAGRRLYFAAAATRFARPALEPVTIRDIRSPAMSAEYVIVTYDGFEAQAQALAAHRAQVLPGVAQPSASVVRISDIYAWYSGGRVDPTSIRNFLYDVTVNGRWNPAPSYVCLLGDASYDFRNQFGFAPSGTTPALVPTYVHGFVGSQYFSDDWLADMDLGPVDPLPPGVVGGEYYDMPDLVVGRLPAATVAEAALMVEEKVIPYDGRQFGEWRNRLLMVADDQFQRENIDPLWGIHMSQSEELSKQHVPAVEEQSKVYLKRYSAEAGSNKVAANRDILARLNEGVLLWNYIGHGNPFQMSDESAFRVGDVPSVRNMDRLPLVVAASCDLGKLDDPTKIGLAEALIKSPVGGAIATIASTEIAYSSQNFALSAALFDRVFERPEEGFPLTLGQALFAAKYRSLPKYNDRKFNLAGDPATRLAHPRYGVRFAVFDDESGQVLADSLPRGRRLRVEGEVHRTRDESTYDPASSFNGTARLWVSDSAPADTFSIYRGGAPQAYRYDASTAFAGDVDVSGGRFTARFYMPMEARLGPAARVRAYVFDDDTDGVGFRPEAVTDGQPSAVDTTGPSIDLRFTSNTSYVLPDAELRIVIGDEHGVNLTGNSQANSIILTLDGQVREDITARFRYDTNSYQQGTVLYRLPNLSDGNHHVRVTATDNFAQGIQGLQNRGEASLEFTVSQAASELSLSVLPFPNPFVPYEGTVLLVNGLAEASNLQATVFTLSGRRVRGLTASGGPGSVQVPWDGLDESGAPVANGVYIVQIEIQPLSGAASQVVEGRAAAFR